MLNKLIWGNLSSSSWSNWGCHWKPACAVTLHWLVMCLLVHHCHDRTLEARDKYSALWRKWGSARLRRRSHLPQVSECGRMHQLVITNSLSCSFAWLMHNWRRSIHYFRLLYFSRNINRGDLYLLTINRQMLRAIITPTFAATYKLQLHAKDSQT